MIINQKLVDIEKSSDIVKMHINVKTLIKVSDEQDKDLERIL